MGQGAIKSQRMNEEEGDSQQQSAIPGAGIERYCLLTVHQDISTLPRPSSVKVKAHWMVHVQSSTGTTGVTFMTVGPPGTVRGSLRMEYL
ncbi:MAG: hypothetical protein NPIRA05_16320 [Nitrospirales bacterium]|nr:MAG: hypothetical protein NPIRA05_16320 [Nitrospirales bacterium]